MLPLVSMKGMRRRTRESFDAGAHNRSVPSRENTTELTEAVCPSKVRSSSLVAKSHSFIVLSLPAESR